MSGRKQGLRNAYRIPLLLGIGSIVGLISALIGNGIFDLFSWVALGGLVPIVAASWKR